MLIYRLERNGVGPFISGTKFPRQNNTKKIKKSNHIHAQTKPINFDTFWVEHRKAIENKNYVFGTKSKELLKAYFIYNLQYFFKQGYRIKTYNVPKHDVIDLGNEVAFHVKHHKHKTARNIQKHSKYS